MSRANRVEFSFNIDSVRDRRGSSLQIPAFLKEVDVVGQKRVFVVRDVKSTTDQDIRQWINSLQACDLLNEVEVVAKQEEQEKKENLWKKAAKKAINQDQVQIARVVEKLPTKAAQKLMDIFHCQRDDILYPLESYLALYSNDVFIGNLTDLLEGQDPTEATFKEFINNIKDMVDLSALEIKEVVSRTKNGEVQTISVTVRNFAEFDQMILVALEDEINVLQNELDAYRPRPIIDFFIFIFGTWFGFKTYHQENEDKKALVLDKSEQKKQVLEKIEQKTQLLLEKEQQDISALKEDFVAEPQLKEKSVLDDVGETNETKEDPVLFEEKQETQETPSVPPARPSFLSQIGGGSKLKKVNATDRPSLEKKPALTLQEQLAASTKNNNLKPSHMYFDIQNIKETATQRQVADEFNAAFKGQLKTLSAMIVNNQVRLPITEEIKLGDFSEWCISQGSRFKKTRVILVKPDSAKSFLSQAVQANRKQIDSDSDSESDDNDFSDTIVAAFSNPKKYLQTSSKSSVKKDPLPAATKKEEPKNMNLFVVKSKVDEVHSFLQSADVSYEIKDITDDSTQKKFIIQQVDSKNGSFFDGLAQLDLPDNVQIAPRDPFGKAYDASVNKLKNQKRQQASLTTSSVLDEEPKGFFMKITDENLFHLGQFLESQKIEATQHGSSFYLNKDNALKLAGLVDDFCRHINLHHLMPSLSYRYQMSYESRSVIERELTKQIEAPKQIEVPKEDNTSIPALLFTEKASQMLQHHRDKKVPLIQDDDDDNNFDDPNVGASTTIEGFLSREIIAFDKEISALKMKKNAEGIRMGEPSTTPAQPKPKSKPVTVIKSQDKKKSVPEPRMFKPIPEDPYLQEIRSCFPAGTLLPSKTAGISIGFLMGNANGDHKKPSSFFAVIPSDTMMQVKEIMAEEGDQKQKIQDLGLFFNEGLMNKFFEYAGEWTPPQNTLS